MASELTAFSLVSAKIVAWSLAKRTTLPPADGPVPTRTLPSARARAHVAVVPASGGTGTLPSVQPARTTPSEPTATPSRSPPESLSSESSSKVRVPTAHALPGARVEQAIATWIGRNAPKRIGVVITRNRGRPLGNAFRWTVDLTAFTSPRLESAIFSAQLRWTVGVELLRAAGIAVAW